MPVKRILISVTEELAEVIDAARGEERRSKFLEDTLWQSASIMQAARKLKIKRKDRPKPGRVAERHDEDWHEGECE